MTKPRLVAVGAVAAVGAFMSGHAWGLGNLVLLGALLTVAVMLLAAPKGLLPVALFMLPWSPIMKLEAGQPSVFSAALLFSTAIAVFLGPGRKHGGALLSGLAVALWLSVNRVTLDGGFAADFITFVLALALWPSFVRSYVDESAFKWSVYGLASGVLSSALGAYLFLDSTGLARFKNTSVTTEFADLVRASGFYGDPNYFAAQSAAALSGMLVLWRLNQGRFSLSRTAMAVGLVVVGLTTVSKAYLLALVILILWTAFMLIASRGAVGLAITVAGGLGLTFSAAAILSTGMAANYAARLANARDLDGLTTSRLSIQDEYLSYLWTNPETLLFGQGASRELPFGHAAHNSLIQAVYLFGLVGVLLLVVWIISMGWGKRVGSGSPVALYVGVFLPWMALDVLLVDDFYLLLAMVVAGRHAARAALDRRNERVDAIACAQPARQP